MVKETAKHPRMRNVDQESWLRDLPELGISASEIRGLGSDHWAVRVDRGDRLLVSFDLTEALSGSERTELPLSWRVAERNQWTHLAILAKGPTWFRDPRVWNYFDRRIDDDFFGQFDEVLFYGAGGDCGHAACAYSVAAPGARVLSIRPVATLDPQQAGWDHRHKDVRRLDFRSRFGYGPQLIQAAARVFLMHDPAVDEDAMHAALYRHPFVTRLDCRHLGPAPERALLEMGLLDALIEAAMSDQLSPDQWREMWRSRRDSPIWLRNVAARLSEGSSRLCEGIFLRTAVERVGAQMPRLQRRLIEVQKALDQRGLELPRAQGE